MESANKSAEKINSDKAKPSIDSFNQLKEQITNDLNLLLKQKPLHNESITAAIKEIKNITYNGASGIEKGGAVEAYMNLQKALNHVRADCPAKTMRSQFNTSTMERAIHRIDKQIESNNMIKNISQSHLNYREGGSGPSPLEKIQSDLENKKNEKIPKNEVQVKNTYTPKH